MKDYQARLFTTLANYKSQIAQRAAPSITLGTKPSVNLH